MSFSSPSSVLSESSSYSRNYQNENISFQNSSSRKNYVQNDSFNRYIAGDNLQNCGTSPVPLPPAVCCPSSASICKPSTLAVHPKQQPFKNQVTVKRWGVASVAITQQRYQLQHQDPNHDTYLERGISVMSSESSSFGVGGGGGGGRRDSVAERSRSRSVDSVSTSFVALPVQRTRIHKSIENAARAVFRTWCRRVQLRRLFVPSTAMRGGGSITPHNSHLARRIAGPLNFLCLHTAFVRWVYHALRRRNAREVFPEILQLQREANFAVCVSYLDKWIEGAANKRLNRDVARLEAASLTRIRLSAFSKWKSVAHRWHNRRLAIRALSSSFYISQCVLLARYFFKFKRHPQEKRRRLAAVDALAALNRRRHVALVLWRWQRRLHFPHIVKRYVNPMRRRGEALLMRTAFEKWIKWSCNRMTALMLEQRNLRKVAKVYWRYWRRHTHRMRVAMPCLGNIRAIAERRLARGAFRKLKGFVERIVISLSLEQKTFILLLHRYFVEWRNEQCQRRRQHHRSQSTLALPLAPSSSLPRDYDDSDPDRGEETERRLSMTRTGSSNLRML